jgi:hypothetical protein
MIFIACGRGFDVGVGTTVGNGVAVKVRSGSGSDSAVILVSTSLRAVRSGA